MKPITPEHVKEIIRIGRLFTTPAGAIDECLEYLARQEIFVSRPIKPLPRVIWESNLTQRVVCNCETLAAVLGVEIGDEIVKMGGPGDGTVVRVAHIHQDKQSAATREMLGWTSSAEYAED